MLVEPIQILLVEDNPADAELTQESMASARILNEIHVVENGESALRFLRRQSPYEQAKRPDLVLLDLNMPGLDGREVLSRIKSDPDMRTIPVVALTSSEAEEDIVRSYELNANAYVRKPVNLIGFETIVNALDAFWFSLVKFPGHAGQTI